MKKTANKNELAVDTDLDLLIGVGVNLLEVCIEKQRPSPLVVCPWARVKIFYWPFGQCVFLAKVVILGSQLALGGNGNNK